MRDEAQAEETFGRLTLTVFGPLLVLRFDPGWTTDDFGMAFERLLPLAPHRFAIVSEMRTAKPAGALERKLMSDRMSGARAEINERVVVSAVVSGSMITRGAIRALRWLHPARYPVFTFEALGSAVHECISRLA
jgi:hypothetical protein